jgi:hypothetical protein
VTIEKKVYRRATEFESRIALQEFGVGSVEDLIQPVVDVAHLQQLDQHLARLYAIAARRLHLADWDQSILRKLHTADSLYQKLADENSARRMEVLEWIIILLIAISIVLPFIVKGAKL